MAECRLRVRASGRDADRAVAPQSASPLAANDRTSDISIACLGREQRRNQLVAAEVIRNDVVRADADEPCALPIVDSAALGFERCNADGDASDLLYFFDLDVAVAEDQ